MAAAVTEPTTTTTTTTSLKPRQLQVARIRREEEEESWISGEELYTEGSSDDEGPAHVRGSPAHHAHPHAHLPLDNKPITSSSTTATTCSSVGGGGSSGSATTPITATSEPAQQNDPHLTETTRRLSLMGMEQATDLPQPTPGSDTDEVEEQEEVMLWRPKRGSIKLPHVELDPPATSLLEQVSG